MLRGEWAVDFLHALGNANPDARTINFVASWTLGENTSAKYNPLATCQHMNGDSAFTVISCVREYPNHTTGIDASVKTLENGNYPHILAGLKNNDPEQAVNSLELGVWGTGLGFTTLWRTGDHTKEKLRSHPDDSGGGGGGGSGFGGSSDTHTSSGSTGTTGGTVDNATNDSASTKDIARDLSFIALGLVLLGIALSLTIRTYVPTRQIVKTIADVAK